MAERGVDNIAGTSNKHVGARKKSKPPPKTPAERMRTYRLKKKLMKEAQNILTTNRPSGSVAPVIAAQVPPSSPDIGPRIIEHEAVNIRQSYLRSLLQSCVGADTHTFFARDSFNSLSYRMRDQCEIMVVKDTVEEDEPMEVDIETPVVEKPVTVNGHVPNSRKRKPIRTKLESVLNAPDSYSLDVTNFIAECSELAYTSFRANLDNLVLDIKSSLKEVSDQLQQADETSQKISKFIVNNRPVFKTPINNLSLVKPKTDVKNSIAAATTVPKSNDRKEAEGLEILSTISGGSKDNNLPPVGELKRSKLEIGSRVWAMKANLENVWLKGTVTHIKPVGNEVFFKIRLDNQRQLGPKPLRSKHLAYENPSPVIVPVGTRIIARYTDNAGRSAFYAGIVAEPAKVTNNKRYLIFFDDGCAQYVTHEDVRVVYTQSVDVADDVLENIREFVRGYLQQYPERPMVKLQKDQYVKTEYNSEWSDAKVEAVDCSMVKMHFISSGREEWIYRGSTRLKPLRNELANAEAHRLEGKNRRRHNIPRKPDQPYIEYTRAETEDTIVTIDSGSDEESKNNAVGEGKTKKPKNTARKSLATRPLSAFTTPNARVNPIYHVVDKKSHLGYKETSRIKSFIRIPFRNHDCGIHCREKDDPAKHRGKNPLLVPVLLGWERQLRKFRACGPGPRQIVSYRATCGRHLRNIKDVQSYLFLVKSRITIDFFSFEPNLNIFRSFRPKEEFYKDVDITKGRENIPVSCVNSLTEDPPPYVEYSAERFPGEGVHLNLDPEFLCGCDCTDNCQNPATCACQKLTNYARYATDAGEAGYKFRRLREPFVTGIYECNVQCKCNSQCGNRVVQNGITVRLQMFKTQYKGWGIRCLDDIDSGQFICVYAGQLLTEQGADADGKECGDEYLAELDHIEVVEKTKEGYESDVPEFKMDFEDLKKEINVETMSSDDQYNVSSDSDVVYDTDSEFESSLRSTATSTYATRSRHKNGKKRRSSPESAVNNVSEDSNSITENVKKNQNDLPDLTTDLETFKINPRPPSPESAEVLEKIELKRKPKISDDEDIDICVDSPEPVKKESLEIGGKLKWELSAGSQNSTENPNDTEPVPQRVVAKKSVSMKNPLSSLSYEHKNYKFKSVRSYFGEDSLYIMDAKSKGNIGRYLNHSCEPNVFVQNVFVDTHDLRFPCVAFFAHDSIDAGTELTWDYNYEVGSVTDKVMYCYCEAASCRGRLL